MKIERIWAMPNKWTFTVKPIKGLLDNYVGKGKGWVDPFAGLNSPAEITNDANESYRTTHHKDGLDFLKSIESGSVDGVLFDPPYSTEQALRSYKPKHGGTAGRLEYHAKCADEIARLLKMGGKAISFGWNSNGIGKKRGFKIEQILLINHGAAHNDTIVTVEQKVLERLSLF